MRKVRSPDELTAVVTKIESPQTMGLLEEIPGSGVLKRTFWPVATFQVAGAPWPSPMPEACGPRKDGQGRASWRGGGAAAGAAAAVLGRGWGCEVTGDQKLMSPRALILIPSIRSARPPKYAATSPVASS